MWWRYAPMRFWQFLSQWVSLSCFRDWIKRWILFWKPLKWNQCFFTLAKSKVKFQLASWNTYYFFIVFRKPYQNFCPAFRLCDRTLLLVDFFQCTYHSRLPENFSGLQAASSKHSHGKISCCSISEEGYWSIFKISK